MKLYNFHSHTSRCGHACGEDEQYIIKAIEEGFVYYGMSDHVMFPFYSQPSIRGDYDKYYLDYLSSFAYLKDKYKEQINMFLGMEAEYHPGLKTYYRNLLCNDLEYLILGQHYYIYDDFHMTSYNNFPNSAALYVEHLIKGMRSGLFLYVAHPDIISFFQQSVSEEEFKNLCFEIIKVAKELDMPLELNVSKISVALHQNKDIESALFPIDFFWEKAGQEGIKVIIGLDAHDIYYVDKKMFNFALRYAKQYNLKIMEPEEIIARMREIRSKILR